MRSPLTIIYQVFFQGGGWYVEQIWTSQIVRPPGWYVERTWTSQLVRPPGWYVEQTWTSQLVRPPTLLKKKLDIPPPPTHKALLLQHTVFSKMS